MAVKTLKAKNGYKLTMAVLRDDSGEVERGYTVQDASGDTYYEGHEIAEAERKFAELTG